MYFDGADVEKNFYARGDLVFQEGDKGDAAFLVEMGEIGIFKVVEGERVHLATMNEGELFGEMAIIDGSDRMANAVAMEDSVIISLPRKGLDAMLGKQSPMVKTLIQILVGNLRSVHEVYMMRPRSVQDYMNAIAFHMEGFRKYLELSEEADPSGQGMEKLKAMEAELDVLREQFISHPDKRDSIIKTSEEFPFQKTRTRTG